MAVEAYPGHRRRHRPGHHPGAGACLRGGGAADHDPPGAGPGRHPRPATMRSSSTFGLSLITLIFQDGAEDYLSRQRVMDRISQVNLPSGIQPGLDPVTGPTGEIYRYTLESDTKNLMELSEIQRWMVIPALEQVPGVVNVDNFGGFTMQYQLELDPVQLQRLGVGLSDVIAAINNNSSNAGGSRISRGEQGYVIRGIGLVRTLSDLGNIVVTQRKGVPVLVRDLGRLTYSHQEREGILGKDNNPDTIEGIVDMLKVRERSQVLKGVHAKVAELSTGSSGPWACASSPTSTGTIWFRGRSTRSCTRCSRDRPGLHRARSCFSAARRSALIAATTIPFALASVFILMHLTNMPANLFSLGALDFGIIVDGAIVVTEAVLRKREAEPDRSLTEQDVLCTTPQVARPIFFATLIIITAYLPLFAFERAEAKLFSPMARTVGYALLGALLCTFTLIPGLAFMAFRRPRRIFHNRPLEGLTRAFGSALDRMLARAENRLHHAVAPPLSRWLSSA